MPPPLVMLYSGVAILAAIALITLLASVLTLLTSWTLLRFYRKTVNKLMSEQGDRPTEGGVERTSLLDDQSGEPSQTRDFVSAAAGNSPHRLYRRTLQGPWRCASRYAAAGALYALVMALSGYFAFAQTQINPLAAARHPAQILFLFWTFLWPVVLTTHFVAASAGRSRTLLPAVYFVALFLIGALAAWILTEAALRAGDVTMAAWSGETPIRLIAKWSLYNLAPTLLIVAFQNRRVRAVAPLVLSFMTVVSFGLLGGYAGMFYYKELSEAVLSLILNTVALSPRGAVIGYFAMVALLACLLFGIVGWWLLQRIRAGYQRKTISDQSLALDALSLIFAAFYTAILAFAGLGWAVLALAAYLVFKIVLRAGNKLTVSNSGDSQSGPALLILRVFSLGKRSEALFDAVSRHWRYIGNVQMIAGPDLAISTVAPHRFLAFLGGKLRHLFINDAGAIDSDLRALDARPDDDGRFRINDFFCRADTWQSVLTRLVAGTDAVLMDLRSFKKNNDGCIFEINELLNVVPLPRLVFVTDGTTDQRFLQRILEKGCRDLRPESANFGIVASDVQPLELTSLRQREIRNLLQRLCAAAGSPRHSLQRS